MTISSDSSDPRSGRSRGEPDPVDSHVGSRIRLRRVLLGMSQEVVAADLGVSFQQLQKYESGANRVSASRLFRLSLILEVPVAFFFAEMPAALSGPIPQPQGAPPAAPGESILNSRVTLELIRDFYRITVPEQQRAVADLIRAIGDACEDAAFAAGLIPTRPDRRKPGPKPKPKT